MGQTGQRRVHPSRRGGMASKQRSVALGKAPALQRGNNLAMWPPARRAQRHAAGNFVGTDEADHALAVHLLHPLGGLAHAFAMYAHLKGHALGGQKHFKHIHMIHGGLPF